MSHAKSLRVVGQCLEYAQIAIFELEKYGPQYMLWSDTVNEAGETALRSLLNDRLEFSNETRHLSPKRVFVFSPADISRLDAQAQRQRKNRSTQAMPPYKIVSHGLRILGDHLDRIQASAFRIEWLSGSVIMRIAAASLTRFSLRARRVSEEMLWPYKSSGNSEKP